jgi:curved DNA-binding protein CbpA
MVCRLQIQGECAIGRLPAQAGDDFPGGCLREMTDIDYYKMLQVDREADPEVIEAAHRVLTARLHPETDLTGVDEIRRAELDRAYAALSDPFRRTAYDQQREFEMVAVGPGDDPTHGGIRETAHDHQRLAMGALTERIQAGPNGENVANVKLDFGRYAGWTLGELARVDPDYLRWLSRHSSGMRYRGAILRLLAAADDSRPTLRTQR